MSVSQNNHPPLASATVAEIAHELRAPLGGIEAMAQLLRESGLTAKQQRLVDGLCAAADHLRAVAGDILEDAAAQAGELAIDEQELALPGFLDGVAAAAEARAAARGLAFTLVMDEALSPVVRADGRRIRQMLENLIDNAIKVTERGSVMLKVERFDRRGVFEGLRFSVIDTGPGFTAEQGATLFKSFGRLDNGVSGTGLGLSLVRRFAQAMGGEAGCHGEPGIGARFWFTLRLRTSGEVSPDEAAQVHAAPASGRILVVDDNQANRMIMAAVLEHFGFEMAEAASAEQALAMLPGGRFAAVLMDQTLPGLSGLEALKLIRAMPQPVGALPVIPVTGRVSPADKRAFAEAGANGFVEKPVTARAVREALDHAFAVKPRARKAA